MSNPYYSNGSVTIYHADNRDIVDGLEIVDHVITDPPYSEKTHRNVKTNKGTSGIDGGRDLVDFDSITSGELHRIVSSLKYYKWFIATMDYHHVPCFYDDPPNGIDFIRFGAWFKIDPAPQISGDRPALGWEPVVILHPKGKKIWYGGGRAATWQIPTVRASIYPTEKPASLIDSWIDLFTVSGETILDPWCGSGVVLSQAKIKGRRAIGIDKSEKACEIAARRVEYNRATCARMDQGVLDL